MQNPEGWDQYVGNPAGTARAGLQQLIPGVQLPPAGSTGGAASTSSGSTTPSLSPTQSPDQVTTPGAIANGQNSLVKTLIWVAAGLGAAFIGYKLWKSHHDKDAAKDAGQVVQDVADAAHGGSGVADAAAAAGGLVPGLNPAGVPAGVQAALGDASQYVAGGGLQNAAYGAQGLGGLDRSSIVANVVAHSGAPMGGLANPVGVDHALRGFGPGSEFTGGVLNNMLNYGVPMGNMTGDTLLKAEILHTAAQNGNLAGLLGDSTHDGLIAKVDDLFRAVR
jgi:hypothetical protein